MSFSKIPRIWRLLETAVGVFGRFPLASAVAVVGSVLATWLAHHQSDDQIGIRVAKLLSICFLAMPLLIAVRAPEINRTTTGFERIVATVVVAVLLAFYAIFTPAQSLDEMKYGTRLLGLLLAAHLLVAFIPFVKGDDGLKFWEYNKTLFYNAVSGAFYVISSGIGLMLAILALNKLFDMDIDDEIFLTVWAWLIGFVFTMYFLHHFPRQADIAEDSVTMPPPLLIFLKYVLVPLVILYFIILYAYSGKILFEYEWPRGWISKLILGFSSVGILAYLLSFPHHRSITVPSMGNREPLLAAYGRRYFPVLIPMAVVLLLALFRRIGEYGLTEPRFFVLALACWILSVSILMSLTRGKYLVLLPASLFVFVLGSVIGPFSAYQTSFRNQWNRLKNTLVEQGIYRDLSVYPASTPISNEAAMKISSGISYFFESNRGQFLLDQVASKESAMEDAYDLRKYLGISDVQSRAELGYVSIELDPTHPMSVEHYRLAHRFTLVDKGPGYVGVHEGNKLVFKDSDGRQLGSLPSAKIDSLLQSSFEKANHRQLPAEALSFSVSDSAMVIFESLGKNFDNQSMIYGHGFLLIK
ncbi:MAG: DUF4153 domain-containing protein [Saprospiraceae bacterium]|nr:DUF4153 domain-containing protein [Saprospiraceae bacterium]